MTVEEKVYELLSENAGVTALVPAKRIKPSGNWQNLTLPYIVHFPVSMIPLYTHGEGLQDLRIWDFYQISSFAATYSEARAVANAVRAALSAGGVDEVRCFLRNDRAMPYEADVNVQQIVQDWKIVEALA